MAANLKNAEIFSLKKKKNEKWDRNDRSEYTTWMFSEKYRINKKSIVQIQNYFRLITNNKLYWYYILRTAFW